jgi:ABC-type molybdate transport system substrate-binding protein
MKLKKANGAKKETKESYWIRVLEEGNVTYGFVFYDQAYLETYDGSKTKNKISEYQIVDANQVDIGQYIK